MAISKVGAIGFYDTLTISALGFVDETYVAVTPTSATLVGVNSTASESSLLTSGNNSILTGVNSTASDGSVSAASSTYTAATSIRHGVTQATKFYHGSTEIDKIYVGTTQIYSRMTLAFNARTYDTFSSIINTSTLTTNLSAGSVGDLAILWERRIIAHYSNVPASNTNSGWTLLGTGETNSGNEFRHDFSYKIMTSSDISSGSITSGQGEVIQHTLLFFTPSKTISSVSLKNFTYDSSDDALSSQTQPISSSGAYIPVLHIGVKTTHNATSATLGGATYDASFHETISAVTNGTQADGTRIGYIIQNSTLSDVTTTYTDEGENQQAATFHLYVA